MAGFFFQLPSTWLKHEASVIIIFPLFPSMAEPSSVTIILPPCTLSIPSVIIIFLVVLALHSLRFRQARSQAPATAKNSIDAPCALWRLVAWSVGEPTSSIGGEGGGEVLGGTWGSLAVAN